MQRTLFRGGVGILTILVLLLAAQMAFGARGSAAQVETSPWYFQVNQGDTCSELAHELFRAATRCEELIAVNPHIEFSESGEPIFIAGETYWLPRTWTWAFSTFDGGEHVLGRYPPMTLGQSLIPPPPQGVGTELPVVVVKEVSEDNTSLLIIAYAFGMATILLAALVLRLIQYRLIPYAKRRWPKLWVRFTTTSPLVR